MGWRGTLVLLLLIVGAGAYLWIAEQPKPAPLEDPPTLLGEPRLRDPTQFVALLPFQPSEVVALHIVRGDLDLSAKREGQEWTTSRPTAPIDDFLRGLSELGRVLEIPAGEEALDDYGLAEPQTVVELTLGERQAPLTLAVGSPNPAATGVYVRVGSDGPVIMAGALLTWELDKLFRHPGD